MLVRFSTPKKPVQLIDGEMKQTVLLREVNSEEKWLHFKLKLSQNYRDLVMYFSRNLKWTQGYKYIMWKSSDIFSSDMLVTLRVKQVTSH